MILINKDIINDFYLGKISKEEFLKQFPIDFAKNKEYILLSIKEAYQNKSSDDLDLALALIVFNTKVIYEDEFIKLLFSLLRETWHRQHENIVTMLQVIKSPESIDVLYDTALTKFEYLDYDDSYSLARKCIHALGEINTEYAKEKLKLLAASDIPIIKEKAEKQLYYYKR